MGTNNTPEDQADLVRKWLGDQEHYSSELPGVEIEETDEGVVVHLEDELDLVRFEEAIHSIEMEDSQDGEIHLEVCDSEGEEVESIEDEDMVYVYEVQDFGNGILAQFKVGGEYRRTQTIRLGAQPMWSEGDPAGDVIEQTLFHLSHYLATKYA